MGSIQIIYASTSGHTEYVVGVLKEALKGEELQPTSSAEGGLRGLKIADCKAEAARPEDFLKGDLLILASGSWNTGGIEGELNPHMHDLLQGRGAAVDLKGKTVAVVALGDERYRYTAKAGWHMAQFVHSHGGNLVGPELVILNEPYGQEERVKKWAQSLCEKVALRQSSGQASSK